MNIADRPALGRKIQRPGVSKGHVKRAEVLHENDPKRGDYVFVHGILETFTMQVVKIETRRMILEDPDTNRLHFFTRRKGSSKWHHASLEYLGPSRPTTSQVPPLV